MLIEEGAGLFGRVAFAALGLGEGAVEIGVDGFLVAEEPVLLHCLGLYEIERVGEQLSGFAEGAAVELALDALFDGGVEGDCHIGSITRDQQSGPLLLISLYFALSRPIRDRTCTCNLLNAGVLSSSQLVTASQTSPVSVSTA